MYFYHSCSYCSKVFYTFNSNRSHAASVLYDGIKKHLIDYGEDRKEYQFDEDPDLEKKQMYDTMEETEDRPAGAYEI